MKYVVIEAMMANMLIRILDNGDTELFEHADEFEEDFIDLHEVVEFKGEDYIWTEWCNAKQYERCWVNDEQGNSPVLTKFKSFKKAYKFINKLNKL